MWDVIPCSLVEVSLFTWCFHLTGSLVYYLTLKMEEDCCSKMSINFFRVHDVTPSLQELCCVVQNFHRSFTHRTFEYFWQQERMKMAFTKTLTTVSFRFLETLQHTNVSGERTASVFGIKQWTREGEKCRVRWYLFTSLHVVTFQKIMNWILTAMGTPDHIMRAE
jgi:hypothetical protein